MANLNIALIGYGYWGPNLLRNFNQNSESTAYMLCDQRQQRLDAAQKIYPDLITSTNADDAFKNDAVDAIVIATPVFTHYELAKSALLAGKHVLLEKPMTSSVAEAEELIKIAEEKNLTLMVDHTFLYTGAILKMKDIIDNGDIGNLKYFDSTRINLGLFQPDINVLWDLAPHDLSILDFLVPYKPLSVQATGISHTNNEIENIAYLTVNYESDFIAHFHCSWTSPVKVRLMLLGGDKKMLTFNDLEPTEKIKIYDSGYSYSSDEEKKGILVDYRTGDIYVPKIPLKEALSGVASDFTNSIINNTTPRASAASGLQVIKILEAAQKSIKQKGIAIEI